MNIKASECEKCERCGRSLSDEEPIVWLAGVGYVCSECDIAIAKGEEENNPDEVAKRALRWLVQEMEDYAFYHEKIKVSEAFLYMIEDFRDQFPEIGWKRENGKVTSLVIANEEYLFEEEDEKKNQ